LEAMRAGTPVVVTDVAGNRETVQHGVTGLVVPPDDAGALAEAILTLLVDQDLAGSLVRGGLNALARFDVSRMAAATEALYAELPNHQVCDSTARRYTSR
jgi:D-inositol-3-phosphate glycosyltransferase